MEDYSFLIPDIEAELKKYHDNLKKKYPKIKESCEESLKSIDSLKIIIPKQDDNDGAVNFKNELNKSLGVLLKPIYLVVENKYTKLYLSTLTLLKKFVMYNLINDIEYSNIINYMKDIFSIQNEDIQLKVLEILQYAINGSVIKLTNENIESIMNICKIDKIKEHTKYAESKNAIKLILSILSKKIFDITEEKNALIYIQNLLNSIEGNPKEWATMTIQNSLIKSIRFELICSILETYPQKFRDGEANKFLEENINTFILKIFQINNDQLIGIKLCRLVMIIVTIVNKKHSLIEEVLKYLNKSSQIKWQKTIGLETISELFKKPETLFEIYCDNIELYKKIFQALTNETYNAIFLKTNKIVDKNKSSKNLIQSNIKKQSDNNQSLILVPNKKYILNNNIFITENDQILNISTSLEYIFKLLTSCYVNIKNSYVLLMEKNGMNINISSKDNIPNEGEKSLILNEKQEKIKEMINFNFIDFKGGLIGMLLNINEVSSVQSFINIFQSFIYIYTSFGLLSSRDELLNDLCKLALPNNLENILEIKEKNILIIRTIFNLSHCTNLLEKNSWLIFIQTVQNLYFILIKSGYYLYNDKQQFDINIIMKNIESNIKKYSIESTIVEVQKAVQEDELNKNINTISTMVSKSGLNKESKSKKGKGINQLNNIRILTAEEKENIDILSNVVNNLFTDSNDYDDKTLIDIINALYEDIEKKIILYNKQLKYTSDNSSITDSTRKNSEGEIKNVNKGFESKKSLGKQTTRNDLFKSVMNTKIGGKMGSLPPGIKNFNINFQNEKISLNLSNINFNLVKILGIAIININRINLLWDKLLSIIKSFAFESNEENNYYNTILKFTVELFGYILVTILIKYNNIKIVEEDEKGIFNEKNIQKNIFVPFKNLLNGYFNNFVINPNYMVNPFKNIIENCGTKLNIYGWDNIFEGINLIIGNKNNQINPKEKEILFKIIEQIFNEYLNYLSIFNIEILLDILEKFSIDNDNKNICYSSISFFWQCADIIDNYQKNKKQLNEYELELFKEKYPNDNSKIQFYEKLWKKIFSKLIQINSDKRFDIKKSGINLFAQFFVAKIKSINEIKNLSIDIINTIFFKIFKDNINDFLNNQEQNIIKTNNQNDNTDNLKGATDTKENEENLGAEEIVLFSLQSIGKVIKSFIEENKNDKEKNNQLEIIKKLSVLYLELIEKNNTPQITVNILKNIGDYESADHIFFQENRDIFWEIIEKLINYINNKEQFIEQYSKSVKGSKVIESIIESLTAYFYSKESIEILNNKSSINNNINSLLEIIQKLLNSTITMEKTLISIDPYNLINTEKNIFNLIETIGSYCNNSNDIQNMLDYLLKIINYNNEDHHTIPVSSQSMKTFGKILSNNGTLVNSIDEEKIKNMINDCKKKINTFFNIRKDKDITSKLVKHNIKKKDIFPWEKMIISFNDYILKSSIYKLKDEKFWDEILDFLIQIYHEIKENNNIKIDKFEEEDIKEPKDEININKEELIKKGEKKENSENKDINIIEENKNEEEIQEKNEVIKSDKIIEKNIINFIINILLPNSEYISKNIQQKLLKYLDIESNDENNSNELFSINKMSIENLFNACNYKEEKDIEKEFNNQNNNNEEIQNSIKKYIEIKKNISKKYLPKLFKICQEKIDIFADSEKNSENYNNIKDEIFLILDGLKNLDSYCSELNNIPQNDIIKGCINDKKAHLFILHHHFNKLIFAKSESIKKKIFEIFEIIANKICPEEK